MCMPIAVDRYYTRDEVLALPDDGNRYELVYGELLVSPSPALRHQLALSRLFAALFSYVEKQGLGRVLVSPADLSWGRSDVIVQPDVFVIASSHALLNSWEELRHFHLFVEVVSPSSLRNDRFTKRRLYQAMGVPLYWVIDPVHRNAEVWTPEATTAAVEHPRLTWHAAGASEPLVVDLDKLFAP